MLGEVVELISVYTIISKEDDLQEPEGILKFKKASNWALTETLKLTNKLNSSKTPDSDTSPWNTLGIPEDTLEVNFLSLNKEKSNP